MDGYLRVIPRDLFNESSLLKSYGRLVIALQETLDHNARIEEEEVDRFDIVQDETSGALTIANLTFTVGGVRHRLERPLNSREAWPLYVSGNDADPDFEEIPVFDGEGRLSEEMLALIGASR